MSADKPGFVGSHAERIAELRHNLAGSNVERPTSTDIERAKTPAGGWTRAQLAKWGVPWPPPQGWLAILIENAPSRSASSPIAPQLDIPPPAPAPKGINPTWPANWVAPPQPRYNPIWPGTVPVVDPTPPWC